MAVAQFTVLDHSSNCSKSNVFTSSPAVPLCSPATPVYFQCVGSALCLLFIHLLFVSLNLQPREAYPSQLVSLRRITSETRNTSRDSQGTTKGAVQQNAGHLWRPCLKRPPTVVIETWEPNPSCSGTSRGRACHFEAYPYVPSSTLQDCLLLQEQDGGEK